MDYQIIQSNSSVENIEKYSTLLSHVFQKTSKFSKEFLSWQYSQNPLGIMVGTDAFYQGELIAHHATIPVSYNIFGHNMKGLLAINNVTHPAHQGRGIFARIGNATFEEAKLLNYDFVITVTNANSTYGYLNKFGFRFIAPLDVKVGIGSIHTSKINTSVYANWDENQYRWRFSNPTAAYFLEGETVMSKTEIMGMSVQLKYDEIIQEGCMPIVQKKSILKTWIGLNSQLRMKGLFVDMPNVMKPSPLNLLFKDLKGNIPYFDKNQICFELADFDAF